MPATIKIYPPTPLPDKGVSETQFNIWTNEIEVYLEQESDFAIFLPGGKYENWLSHEVNPDRIANIKPEDRVIARERDVARNLAAVTQLSNYYRLHPHVAHLNHATATLPFSAQHH